MKTALFTALEQCPSSSELIEFDRLVSEWKKIRTQNIADGPAGIHIPDWRIAVVLAGEARGLLSEAEWQAFNSLAPLASRIKAATRRGPKQAQMWGVANNCGRAA